MIENKSKRRVRESNCDTKIYVENLRRDKKPHTYNRSKMSTMKNKH